MRIQKITIKKLKPAKYNPRDISKEAFEGLKKSLEVFGVVDPIIVNKDYTIIGGHQRAKAWSSLGNSEIPCVVLDLDKKQEKKLNVVLNSQEISGTYDDLKLSEILQELKEDDDYKPLLLDKLEEIELDYSDKNQEIDLGDLGDESVLSFKFDHQTYLQVLDLLNNAKGSLECDTNEDALLKLLSNYE